MIFVWYTSSAKYTSTRIFKMAAQPAKIQGGKVKIRKEHIKIYKTTKSKTPGKLSSLNYQLTGLNDKVIQVLT